MGADFRYMKRPRETWFLVYNVPKDLRGHPRFMTANGKPMDKVTESLGTKDPDQARENRNQRIAFWDRQFRMLRHGPSDEDIQMEAFEIYKAKLATKTEHPGQAWYNRLPPEERAEADKHLDRFYLERLDEEIARSVSGEIADYCKRAGVELAPETEPYRKIGVEFIKAKIAAGDHSVILPLRGDPVRGEPISVTAWELPPPKVEPPAAMESKPITAPSPIKKGAETFADAAAIYLKTELADDVKPDTVAEYRRKVDAFPHKDKPLRTITRGMAAEFLDGLLGGERGRSKRTRNQYAALFSAIYKSAIRREKATANPFDGQRLRGVAQVHYEPFTDDELVTLFADAKFEIAPANHTTATALPWCALIGAFSGLRREEIASLMASNIKQTDGVWFFDIRDGKTDSAERVVPVHHALIDAGLLKYRAALHPGSRLFPGLKGRASKGGKLGPALGDAFEAWRKRLGIVRKGLNFHSFRHTVGDRLRKAGVAKDDRGFLLGHADVEMQNKVYAHDGPGLHRLQAIIEKVHYPS
jgi:integrase